MELKRIMLAAVLWSGVALPAFAQTQPAQPFDHGDEVDQARFVYRDKATVPANPPARPLARLELPDKAYHGVLLNTDSLELFQERYRKYVAVAGRKPSMIATFHGRYSKGVKQPDELFLQRLQRIDMVPNVVPFIKIYLGDWWAKGPFMKADDILAGREDRYLKKLAQLSSEFGKPFMLSMNHEMNGDWFTFSENSVAQPTDWTAEKYVKIWRYIHDMFQREGVTNVVWAWCPAAQGRKLRGLDPLNSYKLYYPGDEYVDWIGASFYNDVNHNAIDNLTATYPNKPLIMAEWGTEPRRDVWYRPKPYPGDARHVEMSFEYFAKRWPNLKAFTWFQWGETCDVERVPAQAEVYRRALENPRFLSNK